jgi:AcrR family transcriptional regulator
VTTRLTRKQRQAQTRERLMESAMRVFSEEGLDGASIDAIAAAAGYTKGAFYANFESKDELFLTILEDRIDRRTKEVERVWSEDDESPPEQARHSAADFARAIRADPEAPRLFLEFCAHAIRDESFRVELVTRFARLRERLEEAYTRRAQAYGVEPAIGMDRIVRMVIAICDGWELWQLLEPDAVDERLLEETMEAFTIGLGVMSGALEVTEKPS